MEENFLNKVGLLSKRNQKRFRKLSPIIEQEFNLLQDENNFLKSQLQELKTYTQKTEEELVPAPEKYTSFSEYEKSYQEYLEAKDFTKTIKKSLNPYLSSTSFYSNEIIWFSVIVGLVFDFLLWKDIFVGKFGTDIWAERAERASAIIMSFSYAYICSKFGMALALKMLIYKRRQMADTALVDKTELEMYKKATLKETFWFTSGLFLVLSILSTTARYSQEVLGTMDKFLLSFAAVSVGLVIAAIGYFYHDVYSHFIKAAEREELKCKKKFDKFTSKIRIIRIKV
jgi:hypothetical protein